MRTVHWHEMPSHTPLQHSAFEVQWTWSPEHAHWPPVSHTPLQQEMLPPGGEHGAPVVRHAQRLDARSHDPLQQSALTAQREL